VIQTGRLVHRRIFSLLAFLVPLLLFVGLALRPDVPPFSRPDISLLSEAGFATNVPENLTRIQSGEQTFELAIETDSSQTASLIIRSIDPLLKPDLLVYWVPEPIENDSLPGNAILLGELLGTSFARMTFPQGTSTNRGTLVIYSQAHQDVFAQFPISSLGEIGRGAQE
jgi:hypothetical protein